MSETKINLPRLKELGTKGVKLQGRELVEAVTELPRLVAWASDIITVIKRDVARRRANGEHMEELDEYEELLAEIEGVK